mgnify:CR=1 FL=1
MGTKDRDRKQRAVPTSRGGRLARMARMAGGVAGGMLAEGSRQLRAGRRPKARDMLLTPANARRVAEQLATMRGAAMKVGQMLSMDSGDFLPPTQEVRASDLRACQRVLARVEGEISQGGPLSSAAREGVTNELLQLARPHLRRAGAPASTEQTTPVTRPCCAQPRPQ